MANKPIDIHKLYNLFFASDLIKLDKPIAEPRTPPKKKVLGPILTPTSKKIYDATSPRSKPYILQDLQANTAAIEYRESLEDDPDYQEKLENNGLGFFMENFVSHHGICPVCGEHSLKKYAYSNIPVVDLVCINTDYHLKNSACFIFQLKISLTNDYFNLKNQTIVVGSRVYGEPAHEVSGKEDLLHKLIVPGYICIKLYPIAGDVQAYNIDHRNSFVLVPDYNNTANNYYYQYTANLSRFGKNIISWNSAMVKTINLKNIINNTNIGYEFFNETAIINPYSGLKKLID